MYVVSEGVVLKRVNVSDYDKILTVFTLNSGKISGSVRGSQSPKSKLSSGTHPFIYGEFTFQKSGRMSKITGIDIIRSHYKLRENLEPLALASYFLELINMVTVENQRNKPLFYLLIDYLEVVEKTTDLIMLERLKASFELKFLYCIGLQPELDHCVQCGQSYDNPKFSVKEGGVICEACYHDFPHEPKMGHVLPNLMNFLIEANIPQILETSMDEILVKKINYLNNLFLLHHLGRRGFKTMMNF